MWWMRTARNRWPSKPCAAAGISSFKAPGTGKSQTITNVIAAAIADGKKVLFISEKMAALEVVNRRLKAVGLGPACLELHSHHTNKRKVLQGTQGHA